MVKWLTNRVAFIKLATKKYVTDKFTFCLLNTENITFLGFDFVELTCTFDNPVDNCVYLNSKTIFQPRVMTLKRCFAEQRRLKQ